MKDEFSILGLCLISLVILGKRDLVIFVKLKFLGLTYISLVWVWVIYLLE